MIGSGKTLVDITLERSVSLSRDANCLVRPKFKIGNYVDTNQVVKVIFSGVVLAYSFLGS